MAIKARKVAIVGTGLVGSSCAFALVNQCVCEEIIMIDINEERAKGETWDIVHSVEYMPLRTKIKWGTYKDCEDVEAVIITAGPPPRDGQTRLDTLDASRKICDSIVNPIMESGFNGFFIIVSNPVDIISHYVWEISKLPKRRVIGTGTSVDTARLKNILSHKLNGIDPRSIGAYAMGEHGDSQMVPWSKVTVGGKSFLRMVSEDESLKDIDLDDIVRRNARAGWDIADRKGTTYYGIAAAAVGIIKSIFHDEKKIIPVSTLLEGEYNEKDLYIGVPAVIGKHGVEYVIELEMAEDEKKKFHESAEVIRSYIK